MNADRSVRIVLVGAKDCWRILETLKESQIPVVLEKIHSLPRLDDDDYDLSYKLPKILSDAGLNKGVALSMQSLDPVTLKNIKN